jgi:FMN-dependent NADH-azoreductase
MAHLLHIQASPRGDRSKSIQVARAFLDAYAEQNPADRVDTLDLFQADLPAFDGPVLQAKYNILNQKDSTEAERTAWRAVEAVIDEFRAADKYVFSLPMWNFGIPYRLKHYFDVIIQPGYTFSFDPATGYSGLLTGRPAAAIFARGGEYASAETASLDMQRPYVETALGFMGLTDVKTIVVEPTLAGGPEVAEQRLQAAIAAARSAATTF